MVNATKLKKKIFDKVIRKLGSDLTIIKFQKGARDAYGKRTLTQVSSQTITAVEADSANNYFNLRLGSNVEGSDIALFIDPDIQISNDTTYRYRFTWFGNDYELVKEEVIGRLQNIEIVKVIYLKRV